MAECLLCAMGYEPVGTLGQTPHEFAVGSILFGYPCPLLTWMGTPQAFIALPGMEHPLFVPARLEV